MKKRGQLQDINGQSFFVNGRVRWIDEFGNDEYGTVVALDDYYVPDGESQYTLMVGNIGVRWDGDPNGVDELSLFNSEDVKRRLVVATKKRAQNQPIRVGDTVEYLYGTQSLLYDRGEVLALGTTLNGGDIGQFLVDTNQYGQIWFEEGEIKKISSKKQAQITADELMDLWSRYTYSIGYQYIAGDQAQTAQGLIPYNRFIDKGIDYMESQLPVINNISQSIVDELEDVNYHSLNEALSRMGLIDNNYKSYRSGSKNEDICLDDILPDISKVSTLEIGDVVKAEPLLLGYSEGEYDVDVGKPMSGEIIAVYFPCNEDPFFTYDVKWEDGQIGYSYNESDFGGIL